ncbi:hypothetical protein LOK49_LG08G02810 [Camellia lanceoleosa]|uniref:Uncharacterized protein n=1 Tax=Camellia lanceoleosa TaxID=1840588 RepID=A0ACC0GNP0_9ERIC|nr:hypothetical protein LOK49_LG08G02810 [Camellia lanceoleosa]
MQEISTASLIFSRRLPLNYLKENISAGNSLGNFSCISTRPLGWKFYVPVLITEVKSLAVSCSNNSGGECFGHYLIVLEGITCIDFQCIWLYFWVHEHFIAGLLVVLVLGFGVKFAYDSPQPLLWMCHLHPKKRRNTLKDNIFRFFS